MKRILILIIFFYILVLLQTSFLVHFKAFLGWKFSFSLILIAVILMNFFEDFRRNSGIFGAFFGGFFLDIFSEDFFGSWILILMTTAIFIKFILKRYVRIPTVKRT